jgi:hypothetical protein
MLKTLTKEQEELVVKVKNEWIERAYNPVIDKEKIKQAVLDLYELCGEKKPKEVIVVDSIMGLCMLNESLKIKNSVRASVRASVWTSVWTSVGASVRASVSASVGASVGASVSASVGTSVRASVRASVWTSVGASVRASVWTSVGELQYYGNYGDYGWVSFYDFFTRIKIINDKRFNKFKEIIESGIYEWIGYKNLAIVSCPPVKLNKIELREIFVLHSETESAVRFADGFELYYLYGVNFKKDLWGKITEKKITGKEILELENIEQRMVAMKVIGMENLLEDLNAKLINKSEKGNELYLIENVFSQPAYYLKYKCPSTNRVYVSGIDPEIGKRKSADEAMAWKFQWSLNQYLSVEKET